MTNKRDISVLLDICSVVWFAFAACLCVKAYLASIEIAPCHYYQFTIRILSNTRRVLTSKIVVITTEQ